MEQLFPAWKSDPWSTTAHLAAFISVSVVHNLPYLLLIVLFVVICFAVSALLKLYREVREIEIEVEQEIAAGLPLLAMKKME